MDILSELRKLCKAKSPDNTNMVYEIIFNEIHDHDHATVNSCADACAITYKGKHLDRMGYLPLVNESDGQASQTREEQMSQRYDIALSMFKEIITAIAPKQRQTRQFEEKLGAIR